MIIGGGPAGAAAAIVLARAGRAVTLIERNAGPTDKVCGDFLSAEAIEAVTAMGIDLARLAPAPIDTVRLIHGHRTAAAHLPFTALGLTRRALDEALLTQAEMSGARVLRGHHVSRFSCTHGVPGFACGSLGSLTADTVFLATGKHNLRGVARGERGTDLVGLKMYYSLAASQVATLRQSIEVILFTGGYAGLQLVEAEQAVLCMLVPAARLRAADGQWDGVLASLMRECPHLAERLAGARALATRPLAVADLPYGYTHVPVARDWPGVFRLGDQAAVIASLTGDGVALALASAEFAARTWMVHGNAAAQYHSAWARHLATQMRLASLVHRAALAPPLQPWMLRVCRFWPGIIRLIAARTRIRDCTAQAA